MVLLYFVCFFKSPLMVLLFLSFSQFSSLPPVRVVFAVTMEGSARKVITVRSALIVKNRLETPMELRLDSPSAPDSEFCHSLSSFYLERVRLLGGRPCPDDADPFFLWQSPWCFPLSCQGIRSLCLYISLLGGYRPGPKDWVYFSVRLLFTGPM